MKYVKEYIVKIKMCDNCIKHHFGGCLILQIFLLYNKFLKDISVTESIYVYREYQ